MKLVSIAFLFLAFASQGQEQSKNPYEVFAARKNVSTSLVKLKPIPFSKWKAGMKFYYSSPFSIPYIVTYNEDSSKREYVDDKSVTKRIVTLTKKANEGIAFECDGKEYYIGLGNLDSLEEDFKVEGWVYLPDIDSARKQLTGKKLYILTDEWLIDKPGAWRTAAKDSRKFEKVEIVDVGAAAFSWFTAKIVFKYDKTSLAFVNVSLNGTGNEGVSSYEIDSIFTAKNPRDKLPHTTDEVWEVIKRGRAKIGMTMKEVYMSVGEPEETDYIVDGKGRIDYWTCTTDFLKFENRKLIRIEKR